MTRSVWSTEPSSITITSSPGRIAAKADETARQELERSSVTGGQDNMPFPTDACIEDERLVLSRCCNETGSMQVQVPWQIDGFGQLMTGSATLMERTTPYHLGIELGHQCFDVVVDVFPFALQFEQHVELTVFAEDGFAGGDALLYARALAPDFLRGLGLVPETRRRHLALDLIERLACGVEVKDSSGPIAAGL